MCAALCGVKGAACTRPALQRRAQHRTAADLGGGQPCLHRLDRPEPVAARDRDLLPLPFLVALAAADQHPEPVRRLGQVRDLERHQV
jgi:hypothetical protein